MTTSRQQLRINAASAAADAGDTGPPFFGTVEQIRWVPTVGDTGADLVLTLIGTNGDTGGAGWVFYSNDDCLGVQFTQAPRQPSHNASGNLVDTGDDFAVPVVAAGERIRAKAVAAGNAAVTGSLYVWTRT